MFEFLLRIEGQNLGDFIGDTQDLSTARGGSLALLNAVHELAPAIEKAMGVKLKPVTTGASTGLWTFDAPDCRKADDVARQASRILAGETDAGETFGVTKYGVFSVVALGASASYLENSEAAHAVARRNQLRSGAVVYPAKAAAARAVCPVDLVRPVGSKKLYYKTARVPVSESVHARRRYGLLAKQQFYASILKGNPIMQQLDANDGTHPFALQLNSISERAASSLPLRRNLQDKIAIIYMDGNGFGDLQRGYIEDPSAGASQIERQRNFDADIQTMRASLLAGLLQLVLDRKGHGAPSDEEATLRTNELTAARFDVIRFETLLWGGDEMAFAAPARLAWRALREIIEKTSQWNVNIKGVQRPFHHAIGVAFCHHDAPVARVDALVRRLADHVKDLAVDPSTLEAKRGRDATGVMPVVLESFDHIGDDLRGYVDRECRADLKNASLSSRNASFVLRSHEAGALQDVAETLARIGFPRRRLKMMAHALYWPGRTGAETFEQRFERALTEVAGAKGAFEILFDAFGDGDSNRRRAIGFLEQLWDYLVPEEQGETVP